MPPISSRFAQYSYFCWVAMAVVLPFSTAFTLLFGYMAAILGVASLRFEDVRRLAFSPLCIAVLMLWVYLSISILWSIAPADELLEGWSKYRKLIFIPIFALVAHKVNKNLLFPLKAFAVSNAIVALIALFLWLDLFHFQFEPGSIFSIAAFTDPTQGRSHITQGAFYVISACLAFAFAYQSVLSRTKLLWFISGVLMAFVGMGLQQGRTGYLLGVVAVATSFLISAAGGRKKIALSIFAAGALSLALLWGFSPNMSTRSIKAVSEINQFFAGQERQTSQGIRLQFYTAGLSAIKSAPAFGFGVGSFAESFARLEGENPELQNSRAQPHSEYINMLVQGGGVGLCLWLLVIAATVWSIIKLRRTLVYPTFLAISAIAALYLTGALFNSYLWDLAEGHFAILLFGSISVLLPRFSPVMQQL